MSPNRNYEAGVRLERDTVNHLKAEGYETFHSAGSKGKADVIGVKPGQIVFVSCKKTGVCPPAERVALLRVAAMVGAVPLVASRPGVTLRKLTGEGPKSWVPWSTDYVEDEAGNGGLK